jgi:hypothetical protein
MATFNVQSVVRTGNGVTPTYNAAAATGDKFSPGARVFVHAKNTNASPRVITFATAGKLAEFDVADMVATIPATTGDKMIGPFPADIFAAADGLVAMTYDAETNLTIAVLQLP